MDRDEPGRFAKTVGSTSHCGIPTRMSRRPSIICPTFHVERLNDDRVWSKLRSALEHLVRRGGHATAFVSTISARHDGDDIAERLSWIAGEGHEIAMHTHFRHRGRHDAD